jgi:hypothetical protein
MPLIQSCQDFIEAQYNAQVQAFENPEVAAAGAAAVKVFKANPKRVGLVLVNLSGNAMYLGRGADVSAAKGIFLAAGGGNVAMNAKDDFILPAYEWWVIAPAGASNLYSLSVEVY